MPVPVVRLTPHPPAALLLLCLLWTAVAGAGPASAQDDPTRDAAHERNAAKPLFCLRELRVWPHGDPLYPTGMNNRGQVVGDSFDGRAFLYAEGRLRPIDPVAGDDAVAAWAINDAGVVVGSSINTGDFSGYHPFTHRGGRTTPLPGVDDAILYDIDDSGRIVGGAREVGAFLYEDGRVKALGKEGSVAYAIGNRGDVVGVNDEGRAFVWRRGAAARSLGALDGDEYSVAYGVNEHGAVVGYSSRAGIESGQAFVYTERHGMKGLGRLAPNDRYSVADSINAAGAIVGFSGVADDFYGPDGLRAFLYDDGKMVDLNRITRLPEGVVLTAAVAINDRREITGRAARHGAIGAFILAPRGDRECPRP